LCIVEVELAVVATLYVSNSLKKYNGAVISTDTKICRKNLRCSGPALISFCANSKSFGPSATISATPY
jgi:hypothetical protein